jgi:8-oxo-dGTP diphosphatase
VASRNEVSAGGVVFRRSGESIEVLIILDAIAHRKWALPKGLVNKGESPEQTALREVQEETGVRGRIVAPLGEEKYVYTARGVRVFKTVYYYLLEYESGSEQDHDHEVQEARWMPIPEAIALVAYKGAKDVLKRADEAIRGMDAGKGNKADGTTTSA